MSRRFTGVTDCNGRKIYTGDTVKMHYFYEAHDSVTLGAYEADAEVIGIVGYCWGKYFTEVEKSSYINHRLVKYKVKYYWKKYLQEPHEELEVIEVQDND